MRAPGRIGLLVLFLGMSVLLSSTVAAGPGDVTLFSGGLYDAQRIKLWAERFGTFDGDQASIGLKSGVPVLDPNTYQPIVPEVDHGEAQHRGVLGADFTYSADVTVQTSADAHLQFRISDEGRYGVRLRTDGIVLYRFLRADVPCSSASANSFANHCPDWPPPRLAA